MRTVRLRVWANGALSATERGPGGNVTRVLEFDGGGRYHAVTVEGLQWTETEFRLDLWSRTTAHAFLLKQSRSAPGQILTEWQGCSARGFRSVGSTLLHANNSLNWSQTSVRDGFSIRASGDGFTSKREVRDPHDIVISRTVQASAGAPAANQGSRTTVTQRGGTTTTMTETKPGSDGSQMTRTTTVQKDSTGQVTNQTVDVTKETSGSSQSWTTSTDTATGVTTLTSTSSDASQSVTTTVVTDNTTGQSVETSASATTSTDNQGNTVTTTGTSVKSSDGFSSSLVNTTSSNGSSGYTQQTTSPDGSATSTTSSTDANGNTSTTTVATDASGNQTVTNTSTDSNGNGSQTVDTYTSDGSFVSSQSSAVSGATTGSPGTGSGSGGGGNSGGSGSGDSGSGGGDTSGSGSSGGTSGMGNPDDGTDEGPRSLTSRVRMSATVDGSGAPVDEGGNDNGGDGEMRNAGISRYLQGYTSSADETGWSDASPANVARVAQFDAALTIASADDGWGNLNNPRAVTGLTQSLLLAAAQGPLRTAASGVVQALGANGFVAANVAGPAGIAINA